MKLTNTFISRLVIVAVASSLPLIAAYGQQGGDATTGDDAHPSVDSPYLRKKPQASPSAGAAQTKMSAKDQKFISLVAASGAYEVADGKVAQQQGDATTKNIAARIVNDRSRSNQELLALAKKKGLGLNMDKVKPRSMGKANFDKQYIYTVTHDYDEDIGLFQKQAQSGDDKDVKAWAAKTLPMLQQHHAMLKQAKGSEKAKPKE